MRSYLFLGLFLIPAYGSTHFENSVLSSDIQTRFSTQKPDVRSFEGKLPEFITAYQKWAGSCHSFKNGEENKPFMHRVHFELITENKKGREVTQGTMKVASHTTLVKALSYISATDQPLSSSLRTDSTHTVVYTDWLFLPHQCTPRAEEVKGVYYNDSQLYQSIRQSLHFERQKIEGIPGLTDSLIYDDETNRINKDQEITCFTYTASHSGTPALQRGKYLGSREWKMSPYLYSSGTQLYLARSISLSDAQSDIEPEDGLFVAYDFMYALKTGHQILLNPQTQTNAPGGLLPEGFYEVSSQSVVKLNKNMTLSQEKYDLFCSGSFLMETIAFDPRTSSADVVIDLLKTHYVGLIGGLNFEGHLLEKADRDRLGEVLKRMPHLISLTLKQKEPKVPYKDLMTSLTGLKALKRLDVTHCGLDEAEIKTLSQQKDLEIIQEKPLPVKTAPLTLTPPEPVVTPPPVTVVNVHLEEKSIGNTRKEVRDGFIVLVQQHRKDRTTYFSNNTKKEEIGIGYEDKIVQRIQPAPKSPTPPSGLYYDLLKPTYDADLKRYNQELSKLLNS